MASSAGMFVIRADGTACFDRHFHDVDEFWFIASGRGVIALGDTTHAVGAGDIIYTRAGTEHDIVSVTDELRIFWLTGAAPTGEAGAHQHRLPAHADKHVVSVVNGEDR